MEEIQSNLGEFGQLSHHAFFFLHFNFTPMISEVPFPHLISKGKCSVTETRKEFYNGFRCLKLKVNFERSNRLWLELEARLSAAAGLCFQLKCPSPRYQALLDPWGKHMNLWPYLLERVTTGPSRGKATRRAPRRGVKQQSISLGACCPNNPQYPQQQPLLRGPSSCNTSPLSAANPINSQLKEIFVVFAHEIAPKFAVFSMTYSCWNMLVLPETR